MFRVYVTSIEDGILSTDLATFDDRESAFAHVQSAVSAGSIVCVWRGRKCIALFGA